MLPRTTNDRLVLSFWVVVLIVATALAVETAGQILRVGFFGTRPPLSMLQTGLRVVFVVVAISLLPVTHHTLDRAALIVGAAAAGSSVLFGLGLRSAVLSAFRLLSQAPITLERCDSSP
jgi:hypothetical protein